MITLKDLHKQIPASDQRLRAYVSELIEILGEDTIVVATAVRGASTFVTAEKYAVYLRKQKEGTA